MKVLYTWLSNYRESYLAELSLLYLRNLLQNYVSRFILDYQSPLLFCLQNLHFSMTISPTQHFRFLAVISNDKQVNRSKHAYALTQLNVFAFGGFFLYDIHKTQGRSLSKSGYKIKYEKYVAGKCTRAREPLARSTQIEYIRVTRWHTKYKILNYFETQLLFKRFAYQVQSDYITVFLSRRTNFWDTLYNQKHVRFLAAFKL